MNIVGLCTTRSGSFRVKDKNTRPFGYNDNDGGYCLLTRKLRQLKAVPEFTDVFLASNDDDMLDIGRGEGVSCIKMPQIMCDETLPGYSFQKTLYWVSDTMRQYCDLMLWGNCTCPFVSSQRFSEAIKAYEEHCPDEYDSVISYHKLKQYIWDGNKPYNFTTDKPHILTQYLPKLRIVTNGFFVLDPRSIYMFKGWPHGKNPYMIELSEIENIDIDYMEHFIIADALLKLNPHGYMYKPDAEVENHLNPTEN